MKYMLMMLMLPLALTAAPRPQVEVVPVLTQRDVGVSYPVPAYWVPGTRDGVIGFKPTDTQVCVCLVERIGTELVPFCACQDIEGPSEPSQQPPGH